jgi:hypothetical protein
MAKQKNDWKQLLSAGALVVAVVGTLILGWALQGEPGEAEPTEVVELAAPDHLPDSSGAVDLEPPPLPPEPDTLEARSARDLDRMASAAPGFTLQYMTACDENSARAKLAELEGYDEFYLIPVTLDSGRCFRLCWGIYDTEKDARSAKGVPASLTAIEGDPLARTIDRVIR